MKFNKLYNSIINIRISEHQIIIFKHENSFYRLWPHFSQSTRKYKSEKFSLWKRQTQFKILGIYNGGWSKIGGFLLDFVKVYIDSEFS